MKNTKLKNQQKTKKHLNAMLPVGFFK